MSDVTDGCERERPRLLFFYGARSGPSRLVDAYLAQILQRRMNHETFRLTRICAEQHPDLLERFRVQELPTLIVIERRRVRAKLVGPRRHREVYDGLRPWLH